MEQQAKARLHRLLQERLEYPERSEVIDRQIQETFAKDCAVLVLDLSGFSRLTLRYGIVHFLAMVYRMSEIATPLVQQHQGQVIKQEADNLFAVFAEVGAAVKAAIDIFKAFTAVNLGLPESQDLWAAIGIGYGSTLLIGNEDFYGNEVNLASKLGEDLARSGEILLTEAAYQQLQPGDTKHWETLPLSIAGLEILAYKWSGNEN